MKYTPESRILVVDALRGFALAGIMIIHHVCRCSTYSPTVTPIEWFSAYDRDVFRIVFDLFCDKSYSIFAPYEK